MSEKILIIDDEEALCEILKFNLEREGYDVTVVHSAEEALQLNLLPFDLLIVDIMMEGMSGFDFAKRVRSTEGMQTKSIIFCSALNGEDETVMGLNIGADDYITKPFVISEVKARVRAVLRRADITRRASLAALQHLQGATPMMPQYGQPMPVQPQPMAVQPQQPVPANPYQSDVLTFDGLTIDNNTKRCTMDGEPVVLTKTEFDLLYFFASHPNRIFSRAEIMHEVWPGDVVVTSRTIDTNLARLRKKLGPYKSMLETRPGFGYGFKSAD